MGNLHGTFVEPTGSYCYHVNNTTWQVTPISCNAVGIKGKSLEIISYKEIRLTKVLQDNIYSIYCVSKYEYESAILSSRVRDIELCRGRATETWFDLTGTDTRFYPIFAIMRLQSVIAVAEFSTR